MIEISWTHEVGGFTFAGHEGGSAVPVAQWGGSANVKLSALIAQFYAWIESGDAIADDEIVLVDDLHVASLPNRLAASISLPAVADVVLELTNQSTLDRDDFRISASWKRSNGQTIAAPKRQGCLLDIGSTQYRLPVDLFKLVEALDEFDRTSATDAESRLGSWAKVQEELPEEAANRVRTTGYLGGLRLYYASALSLRLSHAGGDVTFTPVLHGTRGAVDDPLLPEQYQKSFADQVPRLRRARGKYALGDGQYAILSAPLVKVVEVVRQAIAADPKTRRNFARNPRQALRAALGEEYEETVIESLFVETADYSERVKEIGLWAPKVVPWIAVPKEPWLPPEQGGLFIAGQKIPVSVDQANDLLRQVEAAQAEGRQEISVDDIQLPADQATADALRTVVEQLSPLPKPSEQPTEDAPSKVERDGKHVLIITDNFEDVGYEISFKRRAPELQRKAPESLKTALMPHQADGLAWLQETWQAGRAGVLLADDMGLGKTLQALAFLAWLREAMSRGGVAKRPFLIVAPTGLLSNWRKEHDEHLHWPGLGEGLNAYGADLARIRAVRGNESALGTSVLDESRIATAEWVLTTYETARDYQLSFGRVPFSAVIFDEVQKIKTPGTLVTDAAKALRSDFTVALTGTPIENRLADLWCIMDTVQPGYLSDLKSFSAKYEKNPDQASYEELKTRLVRAAPKIPPILLRRTKQEQLRGLPDKTERVVERTMPPVQAQLYQSAVIVGRNNADKRSMLNTIQALRSISLHPMKSTEVDLTDDEFITSSARYQLLFEALDDVKKRNEKALVFLEFIDAQAYLAGLIQRRYQLTNAPLLINGEVSGDRRLQRVNAFQSDRTGFDVMILSPRAGGVGLTLTAANHVIHLSRWWNPAVEDQCTDRIYRIGQKKDITVYYLMALMPDTPDFSFDNRLHQLLMRKRDLSREMLCPPAASDADAENLYQETVMAAG